MIMRVLFVFLIMVLTNSTHADRSAVEKYRNYSPAQIAEIPEDQRRSEVPIIYILAASRWLSQGSKLLFAMQLNGLMYPGLHDYDNAVKAFQVDLGDPPTGKMTVWQLHQLQQRFEMQSLSTVGFPNLFHSSITEQFASVEGTLKIIEDDIAWPINHTKIKCFKSTGQCESTQIYLVIPNESSASQIYVLVEEDTEYYSISRWGSNSIESHPLGGSNQCRETSLSLNFKTKEFYFITRNAGGDCKLLGGELEKLTKPRIGQIVDGSKIISDKFKEVRNKAYEVLASDFRKRVDALIGNTKE